jgi:amino acid adenylation domain-containing protein
VGHRPVLVIHPDSTPVLSAIEVTDEAETDRIERVKLACEEEARRPFDLVRGPILRLVLYRLSTTEHVLLVTAHHIVFDGWSVGIFLNELVTLYSAFLEGRLSPLTALSIQYSDIARDQRQNLQGEVLDDLIAFWKKNLEGMPPHLALPYDHSMQAGMNFRGARHLFELDEELARSLKDLSRREGATLYMTLLAGLAALLHRYTGQTDIVVAAPTAGRVSTRTRALIGNLINTLVLRTDVSGAPTFRELIARARRTALDALSHQDLPFNTLVGSLNPERDASGASLVQVLLVLQNNPLPALEMPGLTAEVLDICTGRALYELTIELWERNGRLVGWFDYDRDLFEAGTIARMAGHLRTLLEAAANDPDRPVAELPLLSTEERRQVVETFNATRVEYPLDTCVHRHIEAQVERTPEAIAVMFEGLAVSYRELDERADRLARRLRGWRVGPEVLVGVCLERSVEMVVGLLAVIKAGGAYVPLDPEYPAERLAFMVEDSNAAVLLTQRRYRDRLPASGKRVICLDEDLEDPSGTSEEDPAGEVRPDNLAYVIYTSGSTGRPKGAMNTHRNVVNRLFWMQQTYRLDAGDRMLQKTPISFDVSVWEIFWPLMTGATLVVARPGGHRDPAYLWRVIAEQGITTMHFVPSILQAFVEEAETAKRHRLRWIMATGEALPFELQERFFERLPGVDLHNVYGPTEAGEVSYWHCRQGEGSRSVPIGRPIANTRLYVLDGLRNPVPVGLPGELYIGGIAVGRGYWRRPELTAERFVTDPFGEPEARMYRTGDLARWRADGNIEYLGRLDHQIKVRGFRVELGEIESMLLQHPAIREAVVVAHQKGPGDTRLVTYVTTHPGATPPTALQLRTHLMSSLPDYMVPSAFAVLETLPLTPSGKVDRKALPAPDSIRPELDEAFAAPRSQTEWELARIWGQILQVDRVGIHDNFFDLGGHSLLASQVISRMNDTFPVKLPLRRIFETPTVAGLAHAIESDASDKVRESIRLLKPGSPGPALFLVHEGLGETLVYEKLARRMPEMVKVFGIEPRSTGYYPILHTRIPDMAAYYLQQIRQIQPEGPYFLGGLCVGGLIAFEMALQLEAQGLPLGFVALFDSPSPQIPLRAWLTKQRQWGRFVTALRGAEGGSDGLGQFLDGSAKAARKLRSFLAYEMTSRAKRLSDTLRFRALRWAVDHGHRVPRFVQGLPVITVLDSARVAYVANRRLKGKAILFRASGGEGSNEALANLSSDPILGWGGRIERELEIVDTPDGHNGMLQEAYVEELSRYLSAQIDRALSVEAAS